MKNAIIFSINLLAALFISCKDTSGDQSNNISKDSQMSSRSMNDLGYSVDSLEKIVLETGDIKAYQILMTQLLDYGNEEMLKWMKIMADRHHYVRAYTEVFQLVASTCNEPTLTCLTKEDRETALKYLNLALAEKDSLALELKSRFKIE